MKRIWDGAGELDPNTTASYTTSDGTIRGRPYVTERVRRSLSGWANLRSPAARARALRETVGNDEWMAQRNGYLVSAIARDAVSYLLTEVD